MALAQCEIGRPATALAWWCAYRLSFASPLILRAMYAAAGESNIYSQVTRNVCSTPTRLWVTLETGDVNTIGRPTDLDWCSKITEGD